jgi:hypothetical protein
LDDKILAWLREKKDRENEEATDNWDIEDPDFAWEVWRYMEAFDWRFLPYPGGLMQQPARVLDMLLIVNWRKGLLEKLLKNGGG